MKNNLLFINQNREIIRKFLEAMKEYSLDIDTASTAEQVVAVFKKKKYKVVITGMDLPGFNGSKIIAYLNRYFPQTVCMVYTSRLELAHLKLLVNERRVFQIFHKSVDFKGEICNAVMEAFEHYDMQEKRHQEKLILEQKIRSARENLRQLERAAMEGGKEDQEFAVFLETMLKSCLVNVKTSFSKKERRLLFLYEKELVAYLLNGIYSQEKLETLNQKLYGICQDSEREKLEPVVQRICQIAVCE